MSGHTSDSLNNEFSIDTSVLDCPLSDIRPLRIELVSGREEEKLWDYLVGRYHYLGHRKMVGRSLKYLVYHQSRAIAAVGWRAAALQIQARDCFIGWSSQQRKEHLGEVANNNRFLILEWVRIPHLASHILGRIVRRVVRDWREVHGLRLFLLETFVNPRLFRGTCYQAAGWMHVGRSNYMVKILPFPPYHVGGSSSAVAFFPQVSLSISPPTLSHEVQSISPSRPGIG